MNISLFNLLISLITTSFIYGLVKFNLHHYSREEREKRKRLDNAEYNPQIHRVCQDCAGTGIDTVGSCLDCNGRGFIQRSEDL